MRTLGYALVNPQKSPHKVTKVNAKFLTLKIVRKFQPPNRALLISVIIIPEDPTPPPLPLAP